MDTKPKKRGRKPKVVKPTDEKKIPKKRGRKPKVKKPVEEKKKVLKKRGRKPQNKSYGHNKNKISTIKISDENIIIHLPIKNINKEFNKVNNLLNYSPDINMPIPINDDTNLAFLSKNVNKSEKRLDKASSAKTTTDYSSMEFEKIIHGDNWFTPENKNLKQLINDRHKEIDNLSKNIKTNTSSKLQIQFDEANKNNRWPENTRIACWWCTYNFNNIPCALPVSYSNKVYNVEGIFCSPECAAAYNFNTINNNNIWEKYGLLNMLYSNIYKKKITLAPPRNSLKKFGGCLTIEQFRKKNSNNCDFKIVMPPLKSIIPSIEYSEHDRGYSSQQKNQHKKTANKYKLQRNNPYNKNTLEECMNIIKT
jgi:hypothetical protein